jgi:hypothetical protein
VTIFHFRNAQITDLQQKIVDADQGNFDFCTQDEYANHYTTDVAKKF